MTNSTSIYPKDNNETMQMLRGILRKMESDALAAFAASMVVDNLKWVKNNGSRI